MTLEDTYAAAIQHDLVECPPEATLVGVVRRPAGWFHALVDENVRALGPPAELLASFKRRHEDLTLQGLCDEGAHNAAWEELDFEERYRDYLSTDEPAANALDALADRLEEGEDVVLVCFENTAKKRCHRTVLRDVLESR